MKANSISFDDKRIIFFPVYYYLNEKAVAKEFENQVWMEKCPYSYTTINEIWTMACFTAMPCQKFYPEECVGVTVVSDPRYLDDMPRLDISIKDYLKLPKVEKNGTSLRISVSDRIDASYEYFRSIGMSKKKAKNTIKEARDFLKNKVIQHASKYPPFPFGNIGA